MVVDEISYPQLNSIAKYLKDPSVQVRWYALKAFSTIGAKAETHIREMIPLLNDKEAIVAAAAATALVEMDKDKQNEGKKDPKITARLKKEVVPLINDRLKDKDLDEGLKRTFQAALEVLGEKPVEKAGK